MQIEIADKNGSRCAEECHRFRIGVDDREATEFRAAADDFAEALTNALLDHVTAGRAGKPAAGLWLQVWTTPTAKWRNVQNPATGGVMAVTHQIAGAAASAATLFDWSCNSVQMARDLDVLSGGLAREAAGE